MTKRRNGNIFQFFKREKEMYASNVLNLQRLSFKIRSNPAHSTHLHRKLEIIGCSEWNVFGQASIGFWNSIFANLGHFQHIIFPFEKLKYIAISSFCHFAVSPFRVLNTPSLRCAGSASFLCFAFFVWSRACEYLEHWCFPESCRTKHLLKHLEAVVIRQGIHRLGNGRTNYISS